MTIEEVIKRLFMLPITRARIAKAQALCGRFKIAWSDVLSACLALQRAAMENVP